MPYNDAYMSNLTLLFNTSGAGVQVSCSYGMIHLKYSAPPVMFVSRCFKNKSSMVLSIIFNQLN